MFAIVCLAIAGVAAYISVQRLQNNTRWVEHTYQVLSRLDQLLALTTAAETAERGYVITADEDYLTQYAAAAGALNQVETELRSLTADNVAQQQRLERLSKLIIDRLAALRAVMDAQRTEGFASAQKRIQTGPSKRIQVQFRALIAEIADAERLLLQERQRRVSQSSTAALMISFGSSLVGLACSAWAALVTRQELGRRWRAEQALRVANENLDGRVRQRTEELAVANASLAHSERRFRALIEHSSDGILLVDGAGVILYRSPTAIALLGDPAEASRSSNLWTEGMHADDRASAESVIARVFADPASPIAVQWRTGRPDGAWMWLEGTAVNLSQDPAVQAIVLNFRNVTRRKEAEGRLQAQIASLNLLSRVIRAIAERQDEHSIYQAVVGTLVAELPVDFCCVCQYDPTDRRLLILDLAAASEAVVPALSLVVGTRIEIDGNGLSRCVNGNVINEHDTKRAPFPFPQQLAQAGMGSLVAAPLQTEGSVFGILIVARREANPFSSGDCEFLRQVAEHVALASHEARLYQALEAAYHDLRKAQQAMFQQERLRAVGQTGIAHDINDALSPTAAAGAPEPERKPPRALRVLLVEDDPLVLGNLLHIVGAEGHTVTGVDSGRSGIEAFLAAYHRGEPFEAVITDLGMPYVDGGRVASAVKTVAPDTLVVLLTGWGEDMADRHAPNNIDVVLSKPPIVREVLDALSRYRQSSPA